MASKGVTRIFGKIGFLPLLLIFFTAAGSAYACPEHRSKAGYRTKAINTRTVSYMTPVVITYGGRCADNIYGTRRVKHVSMMGDGYFEGGARYVAVRNRAPRTRYVALRDIDYDDVAPRYVVRRQPVYVEPAPRYVAVRNLTPRVRYVAASDIDYEDVAPVPRAVSVRSVDTDYDVEVARPKHVVVKADSLAGTEEVLYSSLSFEDTAYVAPPIENIDTTDVAYTPAAYTSGNGVNDDFDVGEETVLPESGATYVAAGDMEDADLPRAVVHRSPELVTIRAVNDASIADLINDAHKKGTDVTHVYDDDGHSIRYRPFVDDEDVVATNTAYVMADDIDSDDDVSAGTVSYVPISDVDDVDATDVSYLPAESASYVPADDCDPSTVTYESDYSVVKFGTTDLGADMVSYDVDDVDATDANSLPVESASYVPVDDSDLSTVTYDSDYSVVKFDTTDLGAEMVSYVPISDVDDVDTADVSYLPTGSASYLIDDADLGTVTHVSNDSVVKFETTDLDEASPTLVSTLDGEPVEFTDSSAILADDIDDDTVSSLGEEYEDMATGDEDMVSEMDASAVLTDPYLESNSDEIEHIVE